MGHALACPFFIPALYNNREMRPEVAQLFHKLADLSPEARALYLAQHPVDPDARREVEELLAHDTVDVDRVPQAIISAAAQQLIRENAEGVRCGAFRLVHPIGRGGMGVVYLAERVDGEVTQRAAVKLLHPGNEVHRERFLQEREILAALAHPNIAHLLDAGRLEDGQPYFAMEYVEGKPIHEHCEAFSSRQKIELFLKVCGAVDYLHRNLVVHRDLKPNNILVTALGEPKLLDFGIAKMLDFDRDLTSTHLRLLTPNYASPEQVRGGDVGTSSDIYSLGAVLHTLLTGKPPQDTHPSQATSELKGDLDLILQTALRPESNERYASAEDFADDLRAYLGSHPIRARLNDRAYRLRKLTRRYRVPVALTTTAIVAILSVVGLIWYRSRAAATVRILAPLRITSNTSELPVLAAALSPDGKLIAYADQLGIHLRDIATGTTRLLPDTAGHLLGQWMPDGAAIQTTLQQTGEIKTMLVYPSGAPPASASGADSWRLSPDRKLRATSSDDGHTIVVQSTQGGNSRELWKAAGKRTLTTFQWSPTSKQIVVASDYLNDSLVEVVDAASGNSTVILAGGRKMPVNALVWPTQNRIVFAVAEITGVNAYNSNLWEARLDRSGHLQGVMRKLTAWIDFPIDNESLSTDGKRLVMVRRFAQRDVYVADIDASRTRLGTPRRLTLDLGDDFPTAWTPDSRSVLLTSDRTGRMNLFRQTLDQPTADRLVTMPGSQNLARLTPDGKSALFCDIIFKNRTCRLTLVSLSGGVPQPLEEIPDIGDFHCSRAGTCVLAQMYGINTDYVVFELDLAKGKGREIYRDQDHHSGSPDISPDGKWLAATSETKVVIRSFTTGAIAREIVVPGATRLHTLYYASDGKGFFVGESLPTEGRQYYVDLSGKSTLLWHQAGSGVVWSIHSPDGKHLAMLMYTTDSNVYTVENY